jgi:hypothetical protein
MTRDLQLAKRIRGDRFWLICILSVIFLLITSSIEQSTALVEMHLSTKAGEFMVNTRNIKRCRTLQNSF